MKKKFWTSDKVVSLTAMFISILTLFIFIWQTNIIAKQNHLSVMPYLMLDSANNSVNMTFAIDMVNYGVGPAFIERTVFKYKGKTYELQLIDFLRQQIPEMDSVEVINHSTVQKGQAIPSGQKLNILTAGGDERSYQTFLQVMEILESNDFDYEVQYKSIYDDHWAIDSQRPAPREK